MRDLQTGVAGWASRKNTLNESTSTQVENVQTENAVPVVGTTVESENRTQGNGLNSTRSRIDKDTATGLFVYQSLDLETEEVVRQFPAEEILNFLGFYQELEAQRTEDESKWIRRPS